MLELWGPVNKLIAKWTWADICVGFRHLCGVFKTWPVKNQPVSRDDPVNDEGGRVSGA